MPMGNTRSTSRPTHGEVLFLFDGSPCFMIIAPFVLKVVRIRINSGPMELTPINIHILSSCYFMCFLPSVVVLRVDHKRLFESKMGHFWAFRSDSLKWICQSMRI